MPGGPPPWPRRPNAAPASALRPRPRRQHRRRTLAGLREHAVFDSIYRASLEILESEDKIEYPTLRGDWIYNFWQDAEHERGIWRRAAVDSYLSSEPRWEILLDMDALSEEEGVPWAFHGAECLAPEFRRCLVSLSRGGSDASEIREFDVESRSFVKGGFFLPEAKSSVAWRGPDELLVTTDFGQRVMLGTPAARPDCMS